MKKGKKMKKGIKITGIILLSFVLLVIAAAFILPYVISMDTFKGMIETKGREALKRDVSVGRMRLSILPTLMLKVENFVIANPPGFSQTPLLSLQSAKVRVKIIPLLFGRMEITGFTLSHPVIFIEKDPQGRLNIPGMEEAGKGERKGTLESGIVKTDESKALQMFALDKASLRQGKFIYLDRSITPSQQLEIQNIDLDIKDLALNKKIRYKLSLQWSPGEMVLDGWVGPLGRTIDLKNIPLKGRLQVDFPDLDSLMKKLSGGEAATLQGALKADLSFEGNKGSSFKTKGAITMNDLIVSQAIRLKGLVALTGDLTVPVQGNPLFSLEADSSHFDIALVEKKKGAEKVTPSKNKPGGEKQTAQKAGFDVRGRLRVKEGTFQKTDFRNLLVAGEMKSGQVKITQFTCAAFKGTVEGDGSFDMAHDPSPFRMKAKVAEVDVDTLVNAFTSSKEVLKGRLNGDVALGGAGLSSDALKKSLTGTGTVQVKEGELPWLNLINRLVQALGGKKWGTEKTTFDDLSSSFTIKNGMVSVPNLLLSEKDTALKLWGDIGLDSTLKLEGEAHLPPSVTKDLPEKGWRFFADDKGRLTIPFTLQGALKNPKVGISPRLIEQGVKGVLEELMKKKQHKQ
jgi:AsmA protein